MNELQWKRWWLYIKQKMSVISLILLFLHLWRFFRFLDQERTPCPCRIKVNRLSNNDLRWRRCFVLGIRNQVILVSLLPQLALDPKALDVFINIFVFPFLPFHLHESILLNANLPALADDQCFHEIFRFLSVLSYSVLQFFVAFMVGYPRDNHIR